MRWGIPFVGVKVRVTLVAGDGGNSRRVSCLGPLPSVGGDLVVTLWGCGLSTAELSGDLFLCMCGFWGVGSAGKRDRVVGAVRVQRTGAVAREGRGEYPQTGRVGDAHC